MTEDRLKLKLLGSPSIFLNQEKLIFLLPKSMLCLYYSISMEQSIGGDCRNPLGKQDNQIAKKESQATQFIKPISYQAENGLLLPTGLCCRLIPSVRLKAMQNFSRTIQRSICCSIRVIFCRASISRTVKPLTIGCPKCGRDELRSIPRLAIAWKNPSNLRNQSGIRAV